MAEDALRIVSPHSAILLFTLDGALENLPEDHSAVGNRDVRAVVNIAAAWDEPADDAANMAWARETWEGIREFSTGGSYINFQPEDEGDARVAAAYGENLARLAEVKAAWDPGNLFRVNKNVRPPAG